MSEAGRVNGWLNSRLIFTSINSLARHYITLFNNNSKRNPEVNVILIKTRFTIRVIHSTYKHKMYTLKPLMIWRWWWWWYIISSANRAEWSCVVLPCLTLPVPHLTSNERNLNIFNLLLHLGILHQRSDNRISLLMYLQSKRWRWNECI